MDGHFLMKMARITTLFALFVILFVLAADGSRHYGRRIRRGFNDSGMSGPRRFSFGNKGGKGGAFDQDSEDDDASGSRENIGGCGSNNDRSGSRENMSFNRDGRQRQQPQSGEHGDTRGARGSFTRSTASATASASAFAQNQKKNALS